MKKSRVISFIVGILIIIALIFGFSTFRQKSEEVNIIDKYNIVIINAYNDGFATYIEGTLIADKDYEFLQIEIPTYDSNGNKVNSAIATVSNIDKGETWKFEAVSMNGLKYTIEKAKVTGW